MILFSLIDILTDETLKVGEESAFALSYLLKDITKIVVGIVLSCPLLENFGSLIRKIAPHIANGRYTLGVLI